MRGLEGRAEALAGTFNAQDVANTDVATSYNNIGNVYDRQGQYERSLEYYQKALEIFIKVSGQDHPAVAASYNNIGVVYDSQAVGVWGGSQGQG